MNLLVLFILNGVRSEWSICECRATTNQVFDSDQCSDYFSNDPPCPSCSPPITYYSCDTCQCKVTTSGWFIIVICSIIFLAISTFIYFCCHRTNPFFIGCSQSPPGFGCRVFDDDYCYRCCCIIACPHFYAFALSEKVFAINGKRSKSWKNNKNKKKEDKSSLLLNATDSDNLIPKDLIVSRYGNDPNNSNKSDFIKCESCNRYQFLKSVDDKCIYCETPMNESNDNKLSLAGAEGQTVESDYCK